MMRSAVRAAHAAARTSTTATTPPSVQSRRRRKTGSEMGTLVRARLGHVSVRDSNRLAIEHAHQIIDLEWLDEMPIKACGGTSLAIFSLAPSSQGDQHRFAAHRTLPDASSKFVSVHARQSDVEEHH